MRGRQSARIRELVWDRMQGGAWPPGARLPAERVLADELAVNRSTVAAVYDDLAADGVLERRRGSGTYVSDTLWGVAPNWRRYLASGASRPSAALLSQIRRARGSADLVDFTRADPGSDFWPTRELQQLWRDIDLGSVLAYAPPEGWEPLREAIAADMRRRTERVVSAASVLITAGASQALYLVARGLLAPGDGVAMECPSYYYSLPLFQSAGLYLWPIAMDADGLLPESLEAILREHRPAMIWLNPTHHNPTGTALASERRLAVLALARRFHVPILEDDAFAGLDFSASPAPAPLYGRDPAAGVIYVGTVSKSVAPGLRVGWMLAPDAVIRQLADVKGQMDLGTPLALQALVAGWLAHPARFAHQARVQALLGERLDRFHEALAPLGALGATGSRPSGGFYQWIRWPDGASDQQWLAAAQGARLVFMPGSVYGAPAGYARFNFAAWPPPLVRKRLECLARQAPVPAAARR